MIQFRYSKLENSPGVKKLHEVTERILSEYPQQKEIGARALAVKGWSHYRVKDFQKSRGAVNRIVKDFNEYEDILRSANQGILQLDKIEGDF